MKKSKFKIIKKNNKRYISFRDEDIEVKSSLSDDKLDKLLALKALDILDALLQKDKKKKRRAKKTNKKDKRLAGPPLKVYSTAGSELVSQLSDPKQYPPHPKGQEKDQYLPAIEDKKKEVIVTTEAPAIEGKQSQKQITFGMPLTRSNSQSSTSKSEPVSPNDGYTLIDNKTGNSANYSRNQIAEAKILKEELEKTKTASEQHEIDKIKAEQNNIEKENQRSKEYITKLLESLDRDDIQHLLSSAKAKTNSSLFTYYANQTNQVNYNRLMKFPSLLDYAYKLSTKGLTKKGLITHLQNHINNYVFTFRPAQSTSTTSTASPSNDNEAKFEDDKLFPGTGFDELKDSKDGLWNYQISKYMDKYPTYRGCFAPNTLSDINIDTNADNSFIYNLMPAKEDLPGHWVAVNIIKDPPTLEYYDPFGQKPQPLFNKLIKILLCQISDKPFQYKINRIQDQSTTSTNCGYFAMKFLIDRYHKIPFKQTTKFEDESKKGEKNIKEFKNKFKNFRYI